MKLASIDNKTRDGQLAIVNKDLTRAVLVPEIALTMQYALDHWQECEPKLKKIYADLNTGKCPTAIPFDMSNALAPLPRAYQWLDGSIYFPHISLMAKASGLDFGNNPREKLRMYQGASDQLLGCQQPFYTTSDEHELDFEAEVGIITDDVPMGLTPEQAKSHIKLIFLLNDFSIRDLQRNELAINFGFIQGKPATGFSAVAVTPDELDEAWDGERLHLTIHSTLNGQLFGWNKSGEDMAFSFPELIAHAAKTRALCAGTIIGSGTVSNASYENGSSCISERRFLEIVQGKTTQTPFMKIGDRIQIDSKDKAGKSIFGEINQVILKYEP